MLTLPELVGIVRAAAVERGQHRVVDDCDAALHDYAILSISWMIFRQMAKDDPDFAAELRLQTIAHRVDRAARANELVALTPEAGSALADLRRQLDAEVAS